MIAVAAVVFAACVVGLGVSAFKSPASTGQPVAASTGTQPAASPPAAALGSSRAAPAAPAGYTQVFLDNFNGTSGSAPSQQNWLYDIGTGWGNKEVDHSTSSTSNVYLDGDGDLVIKAVDKNGTWTSGRIESTRDDFLAPAGGRLEMTASIEQPDVANGTGYWPAFWALGSPSRTGGTWPQVGEMDMLEDINGDNKVSQTLHDGGADKGHPLVHCPGTVSCQGGFHTYSVIIDRTKPGAESLKFLVDGTAEETVTEAKVGTSVWQAAIDHGFFVILNLALGGNYPDGYCDCTSPTSGTTSGGAMKVAYVAVDEQGGNSTPSAKATAGGKVTSPAGDCLANAKSLNTSNNRVEMNTCDGSDGQHWQTYSDGTLRTQGGCLDLVNGETSSGTLTQWFPCNGARSQAWELKSDGELYNPYSGRCLTSPGRGTALDIGSCLDTAAQQFKLS
jgi:beta-glucanase (GH16 family)